MVKTSLMKAYQVLCNTKKILFFLNTVHFMQKGRCPMSDFQGVTQNTATSKSYKTKAADYLFFLMLPQVSY